MKKVFAVLILFFSEGETLRFFYVLIHTICLHMFKKSTIKIEYNFFIKDIIKLGLHRVFENVVAKLKFKVVQ